MKRFFTFLLLSVFLSASTYAQQIEKQTLDRNGYPNFVKFDTKLKSVSKTDSKSILSSILNASKNDEFKSFKSEKDQIGYTHEKFQQFHKGIKVENGTYIVHSREGIVESMSGEYKPVNDINTVPSITSEKAVVLMISTQFLQSLLKKQLN